MRILERSTALADEAISAALPFAAIGAPSDSAIRSAAIYVRAELLFSRTCYLPFGVQTLMLGVRFGRADGNRGRSCAIRIAHLCPLWRLEASIIRGLRWTPGRSVHLMHRRAREGSHEIDERAGPYENDRAVPGRAEPG